MRRRAAVSSWTSEMGRSAPSYPSKTCRYPGGTEPSGTSVTASWSPAGSCQAWSMPGPCGPSPTQVGGTGLRKSLPAKARPTRYAATSRCASTAPGKSHSGRSPATGL